MSFRNTARLRFITTTTIAGRITVINAALEGLTRLGGIGPAMPWR